MSYDQRPGRIRVVSEGAAGNRRRNDPQPADETPDTALAVPELDALPAPAKPGLPLLQAAIFLITCIIGGVVVAVVRPFGLG